MEVDMLEVLSTYFVWNIKFIFPFLTFVGCVYYFKRKNVFARTNVLTHSVQGKGDFQSNHKFIFKPFDETKTKLVISSYERKSVKPDRIVTDYGSNLRRINCCYQEKVDDNLKMKKLRSSTEDTDYGSRKRKCLDVLFTGLCSPADSTLIVYPARQQEHTNGTSTDTPTNVIDVIDGEENDLADEDFRGIESASTTNNVSHTINTSERENQQSAEGSDSRRENLKRNDGNHPEQGSAHCTSESLNIITGTHSRHPEFEMQSARLQTYRDSPESLREKAQDLAIAGFFYTGIKDKTACFFCGGCLKDWETDDEPWNEHARWFPNCSFVIRNKQQSFVDYVLDSLRHRQSESIAHRTPHQQRQASRQQQLQQQRIPNKLQLSNRPTVKSTGNCLSKSNPSSDHMNEPVYPQFASLASRCNTFQEAGCRNDQQMAEAGFFYKGPGILVCFNCGGHLFTWKPGVNLWNEHARWFPNCTYLASHRDQKFIMDVKTRFEETETVETTPITYPQTPGRSYMLARRRNNLETSKPQSPTPSGHVDDKNRRLDTSDKMDQDERTTGAIFEQKNTQQNPIPSPRQDQNLPVHSGTRMQENLQVRLSQTVLVENAQEQLLRPSIISNRNTSQIAQNRTVYSARVTRHTQIGQVIEHYQWNLFCKLCQEHLAGVTLFPCGHTVCCRGCSRNIRVCCECHCAVERTENV